MSIWSSTISIGNGVLCEDGEFEHGVVLSYAAGYSNHYPDLTGKHERPAHIELAEIPSHCVPGHEDEVAAGVGSWLRLGVSAPRTVSHWFADYGAHLPRHADVVLDIEAVTSLRDALDDWLDAEHHEPRRTDA